MSLRNKRTTKPRNSSSKKKQRKHTNKRAKRKAPTNPKRQSTAKKKLKMDESTAPMEEEKKEEHMDGKDPDSESDNVDWEEGDGSWGDEISDGNDWENQQSPLKTTETYQQLMRQTTYKILSKKELDKLRTDTVADVIDALFPDNTQSEAFDMAVSLLQQLNWNKETVINKFVSNPDKAMQTAGITTMESAENDKKLDDSEGGLIECPQCYDDVIPGNCFSLKCGHQSCKTCWEYYLSFNTKQGKDGVVITCNHAGCNLVVAESAWAKILPANLVNKRKKFVLDHFVSAQPDLAWCPGPNCPMAVKDPMRDSPEVECTSCMTSFCFKCKEISHRPCKCDWAKSWLIKCSSEAENATWILANTKKCPKCKTQIEKSQGCNHMTCRSCKHEFCWLCKGEWKNHGSATGGYYRCNRYEEGKKKGNLSDEEQSAAKAQNDLQKYLHYYQRFDNHHKARLFAEKSLDKVMSRMKSLQELKGGGFNDVSFLEDAVNTVITCRKLLQWTYALGYYMEPGTKEKNLFEHNQEDLEKNTEHLHELSEKPLEELIRDEARINIINYNRVTSRFMVNLMNGIETGLTTV